MVVGARLGFSTFHGAYVWGHWCVMLGTRLWPLVCVTGLPSRAFSVFLGSRLGPLVCVDRLLYGACSACCRAPTWGLRKFDFGEQVWAIHPNMNLISNLVGKYDTASMPQPTIHE